MFKGFKILGLGVRTPETMRVIVCVVKNIKHLKLNSSRWHAHTLTAHPMSLVCVPFIKILLRFSVHLFTGFNYY